MRSILVAIFALSWVLSLASAAKKSGKGDLDWYRNFPLGQFAFVDGLKSKEWVMNTNIIAVHSKDAEDYRLKTFKISQDGRSITAKVYDECCDPHCDGCCTKNSKKTGFLIDMEFNTLKRFGGSGSGVVEWTCLDC